MPAPRNVNILIRAADGSTETLSARLDKDGKVSKGAIGRIHAFINKNRRDLPLADLALSPGDIVNIAYQIEIQNLPPE